MHSGVINVSTEFLFLQLNEKLYFLLLGLLSLYMCIMTPEQPCVSAFSILLIEFSRFRCQVPCLWLITGNGTVVE